MISEEENCARLLRKIWICNGIIAASAFNLRSLMHESYISLLREASCTFERDIKSITRDNPILYASLLIKDVKSINRGKNINFEVKEVDNERLKSHCGLFIIVDGKQVIGGEPFVTEDGRSVDVIMLQIKLALSKLASQNIKAIQR